MILPLQNFTSLVETMAAGLQGTAAQAVDLSVGSVLRALLEACASVALWMQWLILQVLSTTRAATSSGTDLDSWMADFSLARLPGVPSAGVVTFSRYTAGLASMIPVGTLVRTIDGSLTFAVIEDASNPAWNGLSGYVIAADAANLVVPAQATVTGAVGNVVAGAIGLIASAIPAIDNVTNTAGFNGGLDAETDAALRSRFQLYINSRSLATVGAVGAAIKSLRQGLRYNVLENVDSSGHPAPGNFCVLVDDGTGYATATLLSEVSSVVELVRPVGTTYSVMGPLLVTVDVQMFIRTSTALLSDAVASAVKQAIASWIAGLPMAATLSVSKLEAITHEVDSSIVSVTSTLLNGKTADVVVGEGSVIGAGTINVSAS